MKSRILTVEDIYYDYDEGVVERLKNEGVVVLEILEEGRFVLCRLLFLSEEEVIEEVVEEELL